MIILDSARKHGISDRDITYVYEFPVNSLIPHDQSGVILLFGFDTLGRGLEIAYITTDEDIDIIIHAMKIRQSYKKFLFS